MMHTGHRRRVKFSLQQGETHRYAFEEGSGTTTADLVGSDNGSLLGGATFGTGRTGGNALSLDGNNDYVRTETDGVGSGPTAFSWSVWFKADAFDTTDELISQYTNSEGYMVRCRSGKVSFWKQVIGGGNSLNSVTTITTGVWYHAVLSVDLNSNMAIHLDGAFEADDVDTDVLSWPVSTYTVFGCTDPTRNFFDGLIDDIQMYDRVLTGPEIFELSIR